VTSPFVSAKPLRALAGLKEHNLDKDLVDTLKEALEEEFTSFEMSWLCWHAGLNLAVIFHEMSAVDALATAVERGVEQTDVRAQIEHLYELLHGFAPLLKKSPAKLLFASEIIGCGQAHTDSRSNSTRLSFRPLCLRIRSRTFRVRGPSNCLQAVSAIYSTTHCFGHATERAR